MFTEMFFLLQHSLSLSGGDSCYVSIRMNTNSDCSLMNNIPEKSMYLHTSAENCLLLLGNYNFFTTCVFFIQHSDVAPPVENVVTSQRQESGAAVVKRPLTVAIVKPVQSEV